MHLAILDLKDQQEAPVPKDHKEYLAYKVLLDLLEPLERGDYKVFLVHRVAKAI